MESLSNLRVSCMGVYSLCVYLRVHYGRNIE